MDPHEHRSGAAARHSVRLTILFAFAYCAWIGAHWLPLDWSANELSASASRVWDVKTEIATHHALPWWTPNFMSGSSYALNHARGFYLVGWILFSPFMSLAAAGKLLALVAMFAGTIAMYFCARQLLANRWAAAAAALAFLLHPQQLIRAPGAEHITVALFFPFIPLMWLMLARVLETHRWRDIFACAVVLAGALWTDNKQTLINALYLVGYLVYWLCAPEHRRQWLRAARTLVATAVTTAMLGAFAIVPAATEQHFVKLFAGDPLAEWQSMYSFKSLFGLVDRNGVVSAAARDSVLQAAQSRGGFPDPADLDAFRYLAAASATDSPEKYTGIVWAFLATAVILFNQRRQNRPLLWMFVALLLFSCALASGPRTIWAANRLMLAAWFSLPGVSRFAYFAMLATLAVAAAFLWQLWRRKLTTRRKLLVAGAALAAFLFVPAFELVSMLPLFKDIRAPYAFYDGPITFFSAMLVGFFVTDVLAGRTRRQYLPVIVSALIVLLLIDYWPYQKPASDNGVPTRTLRNLEAAYSRLRADADWVKTYSVSGRYFHLLGPMWSGKPQVYEAFYNWMAPLGIGVLHKQATTSLEAQRAFLDLVGARYIVFDKSDPARSAPAGLLEAYRRIFRVQSEDEDFAVFRNDSAHAYLTCYARACLYVGSPAGSAPLSLELAAHGWPLVCSPVPRIGNYEKTYQEGEASSPPAATNAVVPLSDVTLVRERHGVVRARATAPRPCLAVIAESYYPFWHAEIDGTAVEVQRVSTALMGIDLPAGAHEIVLRYEAPITYLLAGVLSALAFVLGAALVVWDERRSGARRRGVSPGGVAASPENVRSQAAQ